MSATVFREILEAGLKGAAKTAEELHAVETLIAKSGDDLVKAVENGTHDEWFASALKNADSLDGPAREFLTGARFKGVVSKLSSQKAFMDDFRRQFNQASRGKPVDLGAMLKKHGVDENSPVAKVAKQALERAPADNTTARDAARGQFFANHNLYVDLDQAARLADNPLTGAMYRFMAGSFRGVHAAYKLRYPLVLGSIITAVALHKSTNGESSKAIGAAAQESVRAGITVVEKVSPAAAEFLKKAGKESALFLMEFSGAKTDTLQTMIKTAAEREGITLKDEDAKALAHLIGASPLQAVLAHEGIDIDPAELAQIYKDAEDAPDRNAYIKERLQEKFKISPEKADSYMKASEAIKADISGVAKEAREQGLKQTVETKAKSALVVAQNTAANATEHAIDKVKEKAHSTLMPPLLMAFYDKLMEIFEEIKGFLTGLTDTFNNAVSGIGHDIMSHLFPSQDEVKSNPNVVSQESTGVRTNLILPLPAPAPGS